MGNLPKYMKRVKGKKNLYFIRDFPKAYQDIIGKPRHRRSLGTADPKLAESPFAREGAEYHRLLDAARLGKTLDFAYGKLKNKRISNMKRGLTGGKDEPDTFHIDPEDLHEPSLLIEVENFKHHERIEELELLRDSGRKGVTEANEEIEALQCLINGTLPTGATEGITAPLLSATIKEWEASKTRDGLKTITVNHKVTKAQAFLDFTGDKAMYRYKRSDGGKFYKHLQQQLNQKGELLSADTLRKYIRAVNGVFKFADERRHDVRHADHFSHWGNKSEGSQR